MLKAVGSAVGFLYVALSWMTETTSPVLWNLLSLANIGAALLWIAGIYLLLAEIGRIDGARAETSATPNAGPAASVDNTGAPVGPPSVS